eukprot:452191_1
MSAFFRLFAVTGLIAIVSPQSKIWSSDGHGNTEYPTSKPVSPPTSKPIGPVTPVPTTSTSECKRHRKAWHLISDFERDLYIKGFIRLSDMGIMTKFTMQHATLSVQQQGHSTAAFLPLHRYFIWELETQFRSLGDEYECFSLPYWDWSYETTQTS